MKKILLIGQCTLHWGRMEFGNIGNFYIIEPFVRQLHEIFDDVQINTTFQMSNIFCDKENVNVLPMDLYYSWEKNDTERALLELSSAQIYKKTGFLPITSPYIKAVLESDLVIDFSGDIWGDNADFLGKDRFLIGLIKDRVAQLLGKPTVMLAGSPGPFNNQKTKAFAKEVFNNFDLVTNRESLSSDILKDNGFDVSKVKSLACPAFLFEPVYISNNNYIEREGLNDKTKPIAGFIICGWNFTEGPFDKKIRKDNEFIKFAKAIEYISENLGAKVCLMSHSNGFLTPPNIFRLTHGRDYPIAKQLQRVLEQRNIAKNVICLDGIYDAWTTKSIINNFDLLVSGRIHGAVAGLSQMIPTVMIDYGHEPKAHKIRGFADVVGVSEYVADPSHEEDLKEKIERCWQNRVAYKNYLMTTIPKVQKTAKENFTLLKKII